MRAVLSPLSGGSCYYCVRFSCANFLLRKPVFSWGPRSPSPGPLGPPGPPRPSLAGRERASPTGCTPSSRLGSDWPSLEHRPTPRPISVAQGHGVGCPGRVSCVNQLRWLWLSLGQGPPKATPVAEGGQAVLQGSTHTPPSPGGQGAEGQSPGGHRGAALGGCTIQRPSRPRS